MTKLFKFIGISLLLFSALSCEEKDWKEPEIKLVQVYSLTDISGPDTPLKINVYQTESLIIEYTSEVNVKKFTTSDYRDSSTEDSFDITVKKNLDNNTITYNITGDKSTGMGTLKIMGEEISEFDVTVTETEVYN